MPTELRGVIIGAGFFAGFQAEAWRRIPGAKITAVADLDGARAAAFAARWGIERSYADAGEMLARERPDFVDIATRPESHEALCQLAAEHRAHVICQKPLAPTWDECVAIERAVTARGVRLLVHENWRFQPWFRQVRRLVDDGAVGRPFYASFRMRTGDGRGPEPYGVQPYFRQMPRLLVYETAVHFLDTFRYLVGEIDEVYCRTARVNPVIAGEDLALIQVSFAGGANGLVDANRIAGPMPPPPAFGELVLEGDRGVARIDPQGAVYLTTLGEGERRLPFTSTTEGYRGDSVHATQAHLLACLRDGRPAETEGRSYLHTTAAVFACYESAERRAPVALAKLLACLDAR